MDVYSLFCQLRPNMLAIGSNASILDFRCDEEDFQRESFRFSKTMGLSLSFNLSWSNLALLS